MSNLPDKQWPICRNCWFTLNELPQLSTSPSYKQIHLIPKIRFFIYYMLWPKKRNKVTKTQFSIQQTLQNSVKISLELSLWRCCQILEKMFFKVRSLRDSRGWSIWTRNQVGMFESTVKIFSLWCFIWFLIVTFVFYKRITLQEKTFHTSIIFFSVE